mmetsp:Transcript_2987/g.5131  ORF Transcript_2987/g.5131 Transcript_2987/m.5131 type:complete len:255 (-) Transcript_2987:347-1111(-)|eukprot:CAMPEP_0119107656 /NCGR_PEP_ID=MMETSP1180-20130426/11527_1 /TAXON_ID=3052 ORGANISM="Chlamydomonas cf sp, Strain CCMP681" /NCGR_SAMPLE_ID=MMETSP1180 /ASSEMBLY_ACC=CAM_ASM_000741 /LENGTH=254 /DNA_ID=CAMNT_0007093175 /DNA_START=106 /DNA_END=870 /DNA_ORIENTATION=-
MAEKAAPRARNYSISKSDMEASRLVFVYVRDAKPRRKTAIAVPDGLTWAEFVGQVKLKLKIAGVKEINLALSGQPVTSLDELQDIDELCVVEGAEPPPPSTTQGVALEITQQPSDRQGYSAEKPGRHKSGGQPGGETSRQTDDEGKYSRRAGPLTRMLQRIMPSFFLPSLPVTTRDVNGPGAGAHNAEVPDRFLRRRRGKRSILTPGKVLLLLAIASSLMMMLWFLFRAPLVGLGAQQAQNQGQVEAAIAVLSQ